MLPNDSLEDTLVRTECKLARTAASAEGQAQCSLARTPVSAPVKTPQVPEVNLGRA